MGGFSLEGAKIIGSGSSSGDAQLVIKKDDKELIRNGKGLRRGRSVRSLANGRRNPRPREKEIPR